MRKEKNNKDFENSEAISLQDSNLSYAEQGAEIVAGLDDESYDDMLGLLGGLGDLNSSLPMEIDASSFKTIRMDKKYFAPLHLKDFDSNMRYDTMHDLLTPINANEVSNLLIKPTSTMKIKEILNKSIVDIEAKIRRARSGKLDLKESEIIELEKQRSSLQDQINNITTENRFYNLSLGQLISAENEKDLEAVVYDKKRNKSMENIELDRGLNNLLGKSLGVTGFNASQVDDVNFVFNPGELSAFMPFTQNNKLDGEQVVGLDTHSDIDGKLTPVRHTLFKDVPEGSIDFENENALTSGASGTGKTYSSILRMFDMIDMGMRLCILDSEGQFGGITKALGGIDIIFSPDIAFPINFLEINEEPRVDADGTVIKDEKIVYLNKHYTKAEGLLGDLFAHANQGKRLTPSQSNIIMFASRYLFSVVREITIYPESLYRIDEDGHKVKKSMPEINEYVELIRLLSRAASFAKKRKAGVELTREENILLGKVLQLLAVMEYYTFDEFFQEEGINYEDLDILFNSLKKFSKKHGGNLTQFDTQTNKDSQLYKWAGVPIINLNIKKLIESAGGPDEFASNFIIKILASWMRQDFYNTNLHLKKALIIDECWRYMQRKHDWQNAVYDEMLEAAKTIRKRNGLMWLITQSLTEFNNDEGKGLLQNIKTRIILAPGKEEDNIEAAYQIGLDKGMVATLNNNLLADIKGYSYMLLDGSWYYIKSSPSAAEHKLISESYSAVQ